MLLRSAPKSIVGRSSEVSDLGHASPRFPSLLAAGKCDGEFWPQGIKTSSLFLPSDVRHACEVWARKGGSHGESCGKLKLEKK